MVDSPTRPPLLPASLWQRGLLALVWVVLAVVFMAPPLTALKPDLDSSIHASYAYFTAHGLQFGAEVNTTAGPYGFVPYGWDFSGDLYWKRWGLVIAYGLSLSALSLWFFCAGRGWIRWIWLVVVPASCLLGDNLYNLPILLGGLFLALTLADEKQRWGHTAICVLLGFVALTKGPALVEVALALGVIAALAWWIGAWRRFGWVLASFTLALLGWWIAAGQNPLNLPAYAYGVWQISTGYNEAMSLAEPVGVLQRGLMLAGALLGFFLWGCWRHRREPALAAVCVLCLGLGFIGWKHGYVRADGHILIFLDLGVLLATCLPMAERVARRETGRALALIEPLCLLGVAVLSVAAVEYSFPGRSKMMLQGVGARWADSADFAFHPVRRLEKLRGQLEENRQRWELYTTRRRIGSRSVDFFGHDLGYLLLTRLNYRPPPMCCGAYHVYNAYFKERNVAHYLDPQTRPDFILLRTQTVDGRWAGQDDSLSLQAILGNYRPVLIERDPWVESDTVLLEAQPGVKPLATPRPLGTQPIKFDEMIEVPRVANNELLLFSVELPYSWRGRIQGFLHKPPIVAMQVEGEGLDAAQQHRIIPGSIAVPSLLSPALGKTADFLSLYSDRPGKTVRKLKLVSPDPAGFDAGRLRIAFSVVPRPAPVTGVIPRGYPRAVYTQIPDFVEPEDSGVHFYHELLTHYMHSPSKIGYNLNGDERAIEFTFGIDEGAYLNGKTNGVVYVVELLRPDGTTQELYWRYLRPLTVVEDRGLHRVHVAIPPDAGAGARLIVRTDPGDYNDGGWDWAFITSVNIVRER